jgi:hypothetical protein
MESKDDIFEREIEMCKQLSKKNDGKCGWGRCEDCGVIAILYKIYKGQILEGKELSKIKSNILEK